MFLVALVGAVLLFGLLRILIGFWGVLKIRWFLLDNFPTRPYHWLFGHVKEFPGLNEEGLLFNLDMASRFPRAYVGLIGPFPRLNLSHPETIKQITKHTVPKQVQFGGAYGLVMPWIGEGLLISAGAKWFRNRRLLTPGFHFEILKPYVDVYNQCCDVFLQKIERDAVLTGKSVDVYSMTSLCTLDIILRCAFSFEANIQETHSSQKNYVDAVHELGRLIARRALLPHLWPNFLYGLTADGRRFQACCEQSHSVAHDVISRRKRELDECAETLESVSRKRYVDFLDILLLARDEDGKGLSDGEIRDETETFMFEGHDTTTSAISWCLYNIARHDEVQRRAQEEVDEVLSDANTRVTHADLSRLNYLTQCIKESMRLHTTVPFIGRHVTSPVELDGVQLPVGTSIDINLWNMHHNPHVWSDAMTYDPDRFEVSRVKDTDSHAFMPFSAGPRNCIGQNFALNEIKTVVARVLHRFTMSVDATRKVRMMPDFVLRAEHGIHLHFERR